MRCLVFAARHSHLVERHFANVMFNLCTYVMSMGQQTFGPHAVLLIQLCQVIWTTGILLIQSLAGTTMIMSFGQLAFVRQQLKQS